MRPERVFLIWSKMVFGGLSNLAVVAGEAHVAIAACFPDAVLQEVRPTYVECA
jgi:hypothetical protein